MDFTDYVDYELKVHLMSTFRKIWRHPLILKLSIRVQLYPQIDLYNANNTT